eukprot:maker-scaffold_8-snap-gene-11.35-mRNA-1 protein AED:0.19 eAED:0.23 QI:0/0/0/1/0/0/3/0/702
MSIKNTRFYATLDVLSGFDFLPTKEEHREIFTLVTRRSAYTLNGAPMGRSNTPALFFDRIINEVIDQDGDYLFNTEENGVLAWLDDLLIYSTSFKNLCIILEKLLQRAIFQKARFNLRICGFGEEHTIWCGREIRDGHWKFSPAFFDKILNMPKSIYRHEAAQLVYLANWLSPNIPKLSQLQKPFAEYANPKGKKLAAIEKLKEEVEWTEEREHVYILLRQAIVDSSKRFLAMYDEKIPLLLFTDSSQDVWSLAVFQDEDKNVTNNVRTLKPRPIMFLSGSFSSSELRWHISSKELYTIIYVFERIGFILRTHSGGIYIYTDHRALLSVVRIKQKERRIYWDRLYRWILRLQSVDLTIFHISSRDNFVSDLLTRWDKTTEIKTARCDILYQNNTSPVLSIYSENSESEDKDYSYLNQTNSTNHPNISELKIFRCSNNENYQDIMNREPELARVRAKVNNLSFGEAELEDRVSVCTNRSNLHQELLNEHISYLSPFYPNISFKTIDFDILKKHQQQMDSELVSNYEIKDGIYYKDDLLVIPRKLAPRYIVMNHVLRYHPSASAEKKYLSEVFLQGIRKKDLSSLLSLYRNRCLHCQKSPRIIRRPYHLTSLAKKARDIIHPDYLYINETGYSYWTLRHDKHNLHFKTTPTAREMAEALLLANFGYSEDFLIITDNGSHFSNNLLHDLSKSIGFDQSFTIAYSP